MPSQAGTIPPSSALSEASPEESLQDLFSRDPEHFSQQDISRVVEAMRELRTRLEAAEAVGAKPKTAKITQPPIPVNPSDLGI